MGNRFAQAYGLTVLSPIKAGRSHGVLHAAEIRAALAQIPTGADSPFARVPGLHTARWVVVDDMISQDYPAEVDHLQSRYLMFVADFDGDRDPFIRGMCERMPDEMDLVWRYCVGWPGAHDWRAVRDYLAQCQIQTTFLFGGYPNATVTDVLRALQSQHEIGRFIERTAALPSGELQAAFRELVDRLGRTPAPPPGTMTMGSDA